MTRTNRTNRINQPQPSDPWADWKRQQEAEGAKYWKKYVETHRREAVVGLATAYEEANALRTRLTQLLAFEPIVLQTLYPGHGDALLDDLLATSRVLRMLADGIRAAMQSRGQAGALKHIPPMVPTFEKLYVLDETPYKNDRTYGDRQSDLRFAASGALDKE